MATRNRHESSRPVNRFFTTPNLIRLICFGCTISSMLFVSKSSVWEQQWYDPQGLDFDYGEPTISTWISYSGQNTTNRESAHDRLSNSDTEELLSATYSTSNRTQERNQGCLSHLNSKAWLEGKRFGNQNSNDSRIIDDDYVASSILNTTSLFTDFEENSQKLLKQTMCAKSSRFQNLRFSSILDDKQPGDVGFFDTSAMTKNQTIHHLSLRLLYLSVHVHQHVHAAKEARYRLANPECEEEMATKNIGKFDFECPDAKFLVVPMKVSGLGIQMRILVAPALIAGIASDRVVVFVNNSPVGPRFIRRAWPYASCSRGDKQCFFLPDTPCVLTHDEVKNATVLARPDYRALMKTGKVPERLENDRVLILDFVERPNRTPFNFRNKTANIARKFLIDPLERANPRDPILPLLAAAADHILEEDRNIDDSLFYYHARTFQAHHAMIFYAMRPKVEYADRIDAIVDSTLGGNHRTNLALGLPIRASDKCAIESECPSFETYMSLMQDVWKTNEKQLVNTRSRDSENSDNSTHFTNIILTSESPDVFEQQRLFQAGNTTHRTNISFPFKFVTNTFDVLQDTGQPKRMSSPGRSKEDILVASLSSLKLQFYAKYSVGNCCSNYHLLLFDYLNDGCGASDSGHVTQCMQEHKDEQYHLCCQWTKSPRCNKVHSIMLNKTIT